MGNLIEQHIKDLSEKRLIAVKQLYESAFPIEEQIPWDDLMTLTTKMPLDFTAYYGSDESFIGITIVYPRPQFNWFWYFAVVEQSRGKGYGQQILSNLLQRYNSSDIILDMESPSQECENIEQRQQRHRFYSRNGFCDTGVGRSFEGIDYTIMLRGNRRFTMDDYDEILKELRVAWQAMPSPEE